MLLTKNLLLAKIFPLHGSTKVIDIYNNLFTLVDAYGSFEKYACIVIDSARAMIGQRNGLVGIPKDRGVHCPSFQCISHQEALCTKLLHMSGVMISVTNIVKRWK